MPLGLLKKMLEARKKRKPMSGKRKKLKSVHYRDPESVSEQSVAGKIRRHNKNIQNQLDQLD